MTGTRQLVWTCAGCGQPITDGTGYVHIDLAAVGATRRAVAKWKTDHEGPDRPIVMSLAEYRDYPSRARWLTHHAACDPSPDSEDYWFDVARAATHAQLLDWTAHLMGKIWLEHTDWANLIRTKAGVDA
jgi:hypothetical protein